MKNYILVILLLIGSIVHAQGNVVTNRLTIKDSLSLNGKWISQINQDSTLQFAGPNSVSTDGAIRKFIQQAVNKPAAGKGTRSDSVLTIDPATRQIAISKLTAGGISTAELMDKTLFIRHALKIFFFSEQPDSLACQVTSIDGQVTRFMMYTNMSDYIYAAGTPPFTLTADASNSFPNKLLTASLMSMKDFDFPEKLQRIVCRWSAAYGDTLHVNIDQLLGDLYLRVFLLDTTGNGDVYKKIQVAYKNNSTELAMSTGAQDINIDNDWMAMPGVQHSYTDYRKLPQGATYASTLRIDKVKIRSNGEPFVARREKPFRISIYRNGIIFFQQVYSPTDVSDYRLVIDNTWNSYEVVLDDI